MQNKSFTGQVKLPTGQRTAERPEARPTRSSKRTSTAGRHIVDLHHYTPRPNMRSNVAAPKGDSRASAPFITASSDCDRSLSSQTTVRISNVPTTAALQQQNVQLREQLLAQQNEQVRGREQLLARWNSLAKLLARQNDQLRELDEEIGQLERSCISSQERKRALLETKQLERSRLKGFIQGMEAILANRHESPGDVAVLESNQPSSSSVFGSASVPSNRPDAGGTAVAGSPATTLKTETTTGTGSLSGDGPGMQE
jgi:hypothetical protein